MANFLVFKDMAFICHSKEKQNYGLFIMFRYWLFSPFLYLQERARTEIVPISVWERSTNIDILKKKVCSDPILRYTILLYRIGSESYTVCFYARQLEGKAEPTTPAPRIRIRRGAASAGAPAKKRGSSRSQEP